jgi:hypothetical protein
MRKSWCLLGALAVVCLSTSAWATVFGLDLKGVGGNGLLNTNEPGSPAGGTGGEIGAGITYDDSSNVLTLAGVVGWGSSQGFTDLSSLSNNSHIHGPTASANGNGFTETAPVLINLARSSNAVTGGTFTTTPIVLTEPQEAELLAGRYYINIHTVNNSGGELRGFLVVPEPSSFAAIAVGATGMVIRRNRRRA